VIEKRRQLQQKKTYKVSFIEALIHTVFDTTDRVSLEWNNVHRIMDERSQETKMLKWNGGAKQPLMLTYQPNQPLTQVRQLHYAPPNSRQSQELQDIALLASIPDNRIQK